MSKGRIILTILMAALIFLFVVWEPLTIEKGATVPNFSLQDSKKNSVTLSNFKGQPLLIHFWASWCSICVHEMPGFIKFADVMKNKGLAIVGISEDASWEDVNAYIAYQPLNFEVLLDKNEEMADAYGMYSLPTSYLVDSEGKLIKKYSGIIAWDSPEQINEIRKLIGDRND